MKTFILCMLMFLGVEAFAQTKDSILTVTVATNPYQPVKKKFLGLFRFWPTGTQNAAIPDYQKHSICFVKNDMDDPFLEIPHNVEIRIQKIIEENRGKQYNNLTYLFRAMTYQGGLQLP